MGLSLIIPFSFSTESLSQNRLQIASLFSFPLRIKTPFRKNITDDSLDDSIIFFTEVECIGNTQIIHMEETEIGQRAKRLLFPWVFQDGDFLVPGHYKSGEFWHKDILAHASFGTGKFWYHVKQLRHFGDVVTVPKKYPKCPCAERSPCQKIQVPKCP